MEQTTRIKKILVVGRFATNRHHLKGYRLHVNTMGTKSINDWLQKSQGGVNHADHFISRTKRVPNCGTRRFKMTQKKAFI